MQTIAHVDPGKGRVYRIPFPTLRAARAMVRGPYHLDCRIVLAAGERVECYEQGRGLRAKPL